MKNTAKIIIIIFSLLIGLKGFAKEPMVPPLPKNVTKFVDGRVTCYVFTNQTGSAMSCIK